MARPVKRKGENDPLTRNPDKVYRDRRGAPTKAEQALLEQYKVDRNISGVVDNTIENIVSESIEQIKEAVDNLIKYGDSKVFRVLPKELDHKMRVYGMYAQEYFGRQNDSLQGQPVFIAPVSYKRCSKCEKYKDSKDFFASGSDFTSGVTCICKNCANEIFTNYLKKYGVKEALIVMCQKLDLVVVNKVLQKYIDLYNTPDGKTDVLKKRFLSNFVGDTNIYLNCSEIPNEDRVFCKSNLHGEPFKNINPANRLEQIYDDILAEEFDEDDENSGKYKSITVLKRKWGDFEKQDLYWLEDKFNEWYDKCEIEGLSREKLVMQLCYEELDVVRTREKGGNVKDKVKSFQSLMKDADLTPKKQVNNGQNSVSQFSSLGAFIKYAEQKGPIMGKYSTYKDVDGIERIWKSIAGAIARTLGKDSSYIKDFEKNYKEYTVNVFDTDDDDEDSELLNEDIPGVVGENNAP